MSILHIAPNNDEWNWAIQSWATKHKNQSWLVSGGSIAKVLAEHWAKPGQIWVADERYVPKTDEKSNFGLISGLFGGEVVGFDTEKPLAESAKAYSKALPEKIPFALLGVGPDGHVASIFPAHSGKKVSESENKKAEVWETEAFDVKKRLSVSEKYLRENVEVLIFGFFGQKKKPVADILRSLRPIDEDSLPVERIFRNHKGKCVAIFGDYF